VKNFDRVTLPKVLRFEVPLFVIAKGPLGFSFEKDMEKLSEDCLLVVSEFAHVPPNQLSETEGSGIKVLCGSLAPRPFFI